MSKSNRIQLSDHFTTGRLLKFTASPIIMMIFTSIYTIVDGFFVSNYAGKTAFTALNLIYPYLQMLGCLGFMIGTGGSALVAMTLGAGDEKRANRLFSMLVVATAVLGVLFSAFGLALLEPVAVLLGATPELLPSCLLYGRILLTFQTAFMLQYLLPRASLLQPKSRSWASCFTVAAGATNMVLDFALVGVAGLRAGRCGIGYRHQPDGPRRGPDLLLSGAARLPIVLHQAAVQPVGAVQSLHKNGAQPADDEHLNVAGQRAV